MVSALVKIIGRRLLVERFIRTKICSYHNPEVILVIRMMYKDHIFPYHSPQWKVKNLMLQSVRHSIDYMSIGQPLTYWRQN